VTDDFVIEYDQRPELSALAVESIAPQYIAAQNSTLPNGVPLFSSTWNKSRTNGVSLSDDSSNTAALNSALSKNADRGLVLALWDPTDADPQSEGETGIFKRYIFSDMKRVGNLTAAGGCFVMSLIGVAVPGIPTVPFVLATSYFLARSSPALNERLKNSQLFGQMTRDWDEHRALRSSTKVKAVVATVLILGLSIAMTEAPAWLLLTMLIFGCIGVYVVLRIPSIPPEDPVEPLTLATA
jgi:uncharacterized membrane protein YbaN (DUF454 family)